MATWLIVTLSVYALIALGFFIAILLEGRKYEGKLGLMHVVVAVAWPLWLIWYGWVLFDDWKNKR
ncbi:MAG: hypothetical protein EOO38_02345 [Cytophagaceae bacterium]|nr:MAG: hypothetical protein EOO38_02345 [Cytophagaceae bacterium]